MKQEHLIEEIKSLKQSLHTMRLTNDITLIGKKSLEMGIDVLIERAKNVSSNYVSDPVIDFASRVARVMKEQRSSTIIFIMQQAYPDDVQGLDQPSTDDILDNIITLTANKNN